MTNVPDQGFLIVIVSLISTVLLAGTVLVALLAHAVSDRPFWQSIAGTYASVGLAVALALLSQWGLTSTGLGAIVVGSVGYLAAGILFYVVPISPAMALVRVLFDDVSWDEAAHYATIGWVAGPVVGAMVVVLLASVQMPSIALFGVVLALMGVIGGGPLAAKLLHEDDSPRSADEHDV